MQPAFAQSEMPFAVSAGYLRTEVRPGGLEEVGADEGDRVLACSWAGADKILRFPSPPCFLEAIKH